MLKTTPSLLYLSWSQRHRGIWNNQKLVPKLTPCTFLQSPKLAYFSLSATNSPWPSSTQTGPPTTTMAGTLSCPLFKLVYAFRRFFFLVVIWSFLRLLQIRRRDCRSWLLCGCGGYSDVDWLQYSHPRLLQNLQIVRTSIAFAHYIRNFDTHTVEIRGLSLRFNVGFFCIEFLLVGNFLFRF